MNIGVNRVANKTADEQYPKFVNGVQTLLCTPHDEMHKLSYISLYTIIFDACMECRFNERNKFNRVCLGYLKSVCESGITYDMIVRLYDVTLYYLIHYDDAFKYIIKAKDNIKKNNRSLLELCYTRIVSNNELAMPVYHDNTVLMNEIKYKLKL